MNEKKHSDSAEIIGRGNRDGAQLFRQWFDELTETAETGGHSAYVFVMGSLNEILKSFDLPVVFPEINSLQTAVRRVSHEYLGEAEDYGYSPDICGYVKADVAVQLRGGEHPMGKIPKPSLAVYTNACNTYIKWAEIWERMYNIPIFALDVPGTREAGGQTWRGDRDFENDRRYVEAQLHELIALCERVTGKKFDIDKLRDALKYANQISVGWERVLEINKSCPAPFNALTDGTIYLGVANGFRGSEEGGRYFTELVEEMEYKARHEIGSLTDEKYRLVFVGVPCYPLFRRFNEMFTEWGGAFIHSTYLWFASGGANRGFEYDLADPIASLAEGTLISVRDAMDSMFHQDRALEDMLNGYSVDGIIYHPIKSCRTVSTGLADGRRYLSSRHNVASLFIESDMMDRRVVAEAQMKNRIDAFFEGLASRRRQEAAAQ
ncbi:MAG TPA: 2-hydroxyacyl-CoA dehydratase family protein [candidate division Zixibacteria bacterium]|nr:2-hydroxyacyl-CoA dehydratase family protein [candidate division Zixibacteria bacterium]